MTNPDTISSSIEVRRATPTSLAFEWKRFTRSSDCNTSMQLGQFKHFIRITGNSALDAMFFALKNWKQFTHEVMKATDARFTPYRPEISFMCANVDILVIWMNSNPEHNDSLAKPNKVQIKENINVASVEPKATEADILAAIEILAKIASENNNV